MIRADATRIAWFLSLQRILHFPRNFMAPSTASPIGHKSAISGQDAAVRGTPSARNGSTISTRPNYSAQEAFRVPKRAIPPIDGTSWAKSAGGVTTAAPNLASGLSPWRVAPKLNAMTPTDQTLRRYTGTESGAKRQSFDAQGGYRLIESSGFGSSGSATSPPLAPAHIPSTRQSVREMVDGVAPDPTITATDRTFPGQSSFSPGDHPPLTPSPASPYQTRPQYPDATAGNSQIQGNKAAVSTIHIDGSALGRWTIQHLERALGKPTTGMTGVDPRAAIPRSRVAPF
jgi:hypothetical protein